MFNKLSVEVRSLGKALTISLVLCLLTATIVYYTGLKETLLASLGKIILVITIFMAGCYVSKSYGSRGLVRGISMGIICFILMLITTLIISYSTISLANFFYTLLICVISGGLGGILGIGLSDNN